MKKFMVLVSLVLVFLLLGACIQIVQPPTEAPTQVPPTPTEEAPTQEPAPKTDEYDDFLSDFDTYFYYLVETEEGCSDYEIFYQEFYYADDGNFWLGVAITGANEVEDDGSITAMVAVIVSQIIRDGTIKLPEKPAGVIVLFVDDDMNALYGAGIAWEGLELYADEIITADELIDNYVVYPIPVEDTNLSEFDG